MKLAPIFHAVKNGSVEEKTAFWHLCKTAAAGHPKGVSVGLTKIAFDVWAASYESGLSSSVRQDVREAFAGSFGSAAAVEGELDKLAQAGQITAEEREKLSGWVAESAIRDLAELTKHAGAVTDVLKKPQVIGALAGFVTGAGVGAWKDDKDPMRGAIAGAIPGTLIGATMGHGYAQHQTGKAEEAASKLLKNETGRGSAQHFLDAMWEAAGPGGNYSVDLRKVIEDNAHAIKAHHQAGHSHLPEFMLKHIPSPTDRLEYMRTVRQLMPRDKKASVQQKLADIMGGLDQGGQPPMDASQPPAGPEAAGQQGGQDAPEAIGEQDPQISDKIEGLDRGSKTIDNMIFLAQQVQLPQLAQELDQMRDQLTQHFADGNAYLPPELQHHFAQSEHAEAFMKKYKQRFGPVAGGGSKKTAYATPYGHHALERIGRGMEHLLEPFGRVHAHSGFVSEDERKKIVEEYNKLHPDEPAVHHPLVKKTATFSFRSR